MLSPYQISYESKTIILFFIVLYIQTHGYENRSIHFIRNLDSNITAMAREANSNETIYYFITLYTTTNCITNKIRELPAIVVGIIGILPVAMRKLSSFWHWLRDNRHAAQFCLDQRAQMNPMFENGRGARVTNRNSTVKIPNFSVCNSKTRRLGEWLQFTSKIHFLK